LNNNKNKLNELQTARNRRRSENFQNIIERQRSTQQARLALIEQASQVASKRRQRFHEQADQMQASKQQSIHRARSQLLISSPNGIMSWELPQASNNGTQQMSLTAGRQRRKSMSNGEPNNKSKHEASQTEKHDYEESVSSGKQVEKTASIISSKQTKTTVEFTQACNQDCFSLLK